MDAVTFNDLQEFLEELKKDKNDIENQIRATVRYETGNKTFPITAISVVSTFIVKPVKLYGERFMVRLDCRIGSYINMDPKNREELGNAAQEVISKIKAACEELQLECRPGIIRPGGE